ncbi:hypothetical protein ACFLV3_05145 [Chloroflexota bacterium]
MIRFQNSDTLQRNIRQDDWPELGIPTLDLVRQAILEGDTERALEFLEYSRDESVTIHDVLAAQVSDSITHIASSGEENLIKLLRQLFTPLVKNFLATTPEAKEAVQRYTEFQRGHFSNITITEEPDRYVVKCDPCGSGGRLMRTKDIARTKQAYPWSWGKKGIPYYCLHCCVAWEIIATEIRGYPMRITMAPDKPEDPCIAFFYKKPELIPQEFFARVGKTPPSLGQG